MSELDLPYRVTVTRYSSGRWRRLPGHRDAATETEANLEARRWIDELRSTKDGVYNASIWMAKPTTSRRRAVRPKAWMAYHEAGHAVTAWSFGYPCKKVSVVPGEVFGGFVEVILPTSDMDLDIDDSAEVDEAVRNDIVIFHAGRAAQERFSPRSWNDGHGFTDRQEAVELASYLVPPEQQEALHADLMEKAREVVGKYWSGVEAVAKALLKKKELTGEETWELIQDATGFLRLSYSRLFDHRNPARANPFMDAP